MLARLVALFDMSDENGPDAKLLVVPATDPRWAHVRDLADLDSFLLWEISHFFAVYKALEPGKGATIGDWRDKATADAELLAAVHCARPERPMQDPEQPPANAAAEWWPT